MDQERRHVPTINEIRTEETAALARAATGLCDALGAERVYAATLSSEGILRFKAAAPASAGSPGSLEPAAVEGIAEAISLAQVRDVPNARPPFSGDGRVVAIPWTFSDRVLGVGVVLMPEGVDLPNDRVLALLGQKVGSTLAALRDCDSLAHRIAQMRDSADLFHSAFENVSDAMKLIDLDGHILRWNAASERMYGWAAADVLGQKIPHVPEALRLRTIRDIRAIAAGGTAVERESAALRADGSRLMAQITVVPFLDSEGDPAGVLSIAREVMIPGAEPHDTDMCALLADAVATPMGSLVGYAQLLLQTDIFEDPARRKRTVRVIEEYTNTITTLMNDVALISGGREGLLDLETIDASILVTDAVGRVEQEHAGAYRFMIDYDSASAPLRLDRRRMQRALASVLEAMLDGRPNGTEVIVSIVPFGTGVCVEFSLGSNGGSPGLAPSGYGTLGLHIARVIVESHGGSLSVGDQDSGVAFRIVLPGEAG